MKNSSWIKLENNSRITENLQITQILNWMIINLWIIILTELEHIELLHFILLVIDSFLHNVETDWFYWKLKRDFAINCQTLFENWLWTRHKV